MLESAVSALPLLLQILQILVRAVVENLPDSHGEQAGAMRPRMKELLGRVSSRHSSDAHIWRLYARLYGDGCSCNPEDDEKVSTLPPPPFCSPVVKHLCDPEKQQSFGQSKAVTGLLSSRRLSSCPKPIAVIFGLVAGRRNRSCLRR